MSPSRTILVHSSAAETSSVWPANVPAKSTSPLGPSRSMISPRPQRAEMGNPLPSALPSVVRSGVTPSRPWAPPGPCRKPVMISSKMRTAPASVHASRSVSRKPGSGRIAPALWKTGSTMTAAIESPSRARVSRTPSASLYSRTTTRSRTAAGMPAEAATGVGSSAFVVGREVVAPGHVVVPAVVVALELEDALATGEGACQPDGVVGRLRPGAAEDDALGRGDHADQSLGELDLVGVRGRERDAALGHGTGHRRVDAGIVVAEEDGPERGVEVDVLVAVDVGDPGALRAGHEQRIRARSPTLALHAAGRDQVGALEESPGSVGRHRPISHGPRSPRLSGAFAGSTPDGRTTAVRVPLAAEA